MEDISEMENNVKIIPQIDELYCKTDFYDNLEKIVKTKMFFPVLITGPTGIAKTLTVNQIAAAENRELFRVNITVETDEDSLMGGFRLKNGNTHFVKGPVIQAMERGAILLLDELDLGSPTKIMCLQSILEGKGYFIKRIGEWVTPKPGFTVIATANTKGGGDLSGLYIATQILNEAFLDRFPITLEATYPNEENEKKILTKLAEKLNISKDINEDIDILLKFASHVRKAVEESQEIQHSISTRRLCDIIKTFNIFGNMREALNYCIARYDSYTIESYLKMYDLFLPENQKAKEKEMDDDMSDLEKEMEAIEPF